MSCKQVDCLFVRIVLWSNSRPTPGLVTYPHQWPNSRSTHSSFSLDNWRGGNLALSLCFANVFFMHITSSRFLLTVAENRRNISSGKGRWRGSEYTHWERLFRTFEPWETFHFSLPSLKDEWEVLGRRVGSEVYWLPVSMLLPVIFFLRLSPLITSAVGAHSKPCHFWHCFRSITKTTCLPLPVRSVISVIVIYWVLNHRGSLSEDWLLPATASVSSIAATCKDGEVIWSLFIICFVKCEAPQIKHSLFLFLHFCPIKNEYGENSCPNSAYITAHFILEVHCTDPYKINRLASRPRFKKPNSHFVVPLFLGAPSQRKLVSYIRAMRRTSTSCQAHPWHQTWHCYNTSEKEHWANGVGFLPFPKH